MSTGGLIGYWGLDETSGTTASDKTGYGNTGTYVNSPTLNVAPPEALTFPSRAVTFNGTNQYVSVENNANIALTSTISVTAWIKVTNNLPQQQILSKYNIISPYQGYAMGLSIRNLNTGWLDWWDGTAWRTSNTVIPNNTWTHVVVTQSGTEIKFYVNGSSVVTVTGANIPANSINAAIGSISGGGGGFFNGSMDDVRIYNRALTSGEISGLYAGSIQPLAGAWSVVRGNPSATAIDSSGNGNTGTYNANPSPCNAPPALIYDKLGTGVTFNGKNQNVLIGNAVITNTDNLSFSCWVNSKTASQLSYIMYVGSIGQIALMLQNGAGASGNKVCAGLGGLLSDALNSTYVLPTNQWVHLVLTRSTTWKLYANGILVVTGSNTAPLTPDVITRVSNGGGTAFDGSIDDVRIYNKALSQLEITDLASGNIGLTDSTLKAWYKFNTNKQSMIKGKVGAFSKI